jgi:hypothetical protein
VGTGGELDWFMTFCEFDVEPGDERMDEVVSSDVESKGYGKREVGRLYRIEV